MSPRIGFAVATSVATLVGLLVGLSGPSTANSVGVTTGATGPMWRAVSAGYPHTCGIRRDRTLCCWGYNGDGELGLSDTTNRLVPTQVGTDSDWDHLSAGGGHTCATRTAAPCGAAETTPTGSSDSATPPTG
jgi:hypothetical protein